MVGAIPIIRKIPALMEIVCTPEIPSIPSIKLKRFMNQIHRRKVKIVSIVSGSNPWKTKNSGLLVFIRKRHNPTVKDCKTKRRILATLLTSSIKETMAKIKAHIKIAICSLGNKVNLS